MKKIIAVILAAIAVMMTSSCGRNDGYGYRIKDGKIIFNTPPRPADQQSMLGFRCEPIDTVRIGFVGLGMRGSSAVRRFTYLDGVSVTALCDLLPERVEKSQKTLESHGFPRAAAYSGEEGYKELCASEDIDLVYLAVPWQLHTPIAVYAMEHGKHVAIEVPAATSVAECWDLVNTSERTRKHCMMLENCCYDRFELTCLNMARQGVFGEIVHGEGAYIHNLAPFWDKYQGDWRMTFNKAHHGDVYPTHGIGPVCQAMDIHRGDRMELLVSLDTDAFVGQDVADTRYGKDSVAYANGDITCTVIRTHNGKSILVEHGTVTPRPYSRMFQLVGKKGCANKYPVPGISLDKENVELESVEDLDAEKFVSAETLETLLKQYEHPIMKTDGLAEKAKEVGGHGGMDFVMDYRLIYCLRHGLPLDMDVYDAAEWSSMVELSELSIINGSMPVVMPDFTRGGWNAVNGLELAL